MQEFNELTQKGEAQRRWRGGQSGEKVPSLNVIESFSDIDRIKRRSNKLYKQAIYDRKRAICMIVRHIAAPAKGWNENVPKICLKSQRAAYASRCPKELPILVGVPKRCQC